MSTGLHQSLLFYRNGSTTYIFFHSGLHDDKNIEFFIENGKIHDKIVYTESTYTYSQISRHNKKSKN